MSYLEALNSLSRPSKALIPIATGKLAWILSTLIMFIKIFSKFRIKSSEVIDVVSFCCGKKNRTVRCELSADHFGRGQVLYKRGLEAMKIVGFSGKIVRNISLHLHHYGVG